MNANRTKRQDRRLLPKRTVIVEGELCALIPLPHGMSAIVNDDMFEELNRWNWSAQNGYVIRNIKRNGKFKTIWMHRLIAQTPQGLETDHRNNNGFDNRKCNLRHATHSENKCNRDVYRTNRLGCKGIALVHGRYRPRIQRGGQVFYFGSFASLDEAIEAHAIKLVEIHGEFATP